MRFVTAASLFDGHDAAISVMRRLLQAQGAEVIHLGHDRSVDDVVTAVVQEDAQGVAISSYQGGHVEYFGYLVERLAEVGMSHVKVYGGGGGVIVPAEIEALRGKGVRIFSPPTASDSGLPGMINELIRDCDTDLSATGPDLAAVLSGSPTALARALTVIQARSDDALVTGLRAGGCPAAGAGARHHRHRRVGQVLADRRAGPPAAHRHRRQGAGRGAGHRPEPASRRRGAARRPDPDEQHRPRASSSAVRWPPGCRAARCPPGSTR